MPTPRALDGLVGVQWKNKNAFNKSNYSLILPSFLVYGPRKIVNKLKGLFPEYKTIPTYKKYIVSPSQVFDNNKQIKKNIIQNPDWVEWLMGWLIGWTDSSYKIKDRDLRIWKHRFKKGNWWAKEPENIPKFITYKNKEEKEKIQARLKMIGNGQAPFVLATILLLIQSGILIKNNKYRYRKLNES